MKHFGKKESMRVTTITLDYIYLLLVSLFLMVEGRDIFFGIIEAVFYGYTDEWNNKDTLFALVLFGIFALVSYFLFKLNVKVFGKKT